jgi:hypothetical protein
MPFADKSTRERMETMLLIGMEILLRAAPVKLSIVKLLRHTARMRVRATKSEPKNRLSAADWEQAALDTLAKRSRAGSA